MIGQTISHYKITATMVRILVLWVFLLPILPAAAAKLDGQWLLEFQTEDGQGRAVLRLDTKESALNVELRIDRHRLVGKAALTGNEFEVDLGHAEQPGSPSHSSRLHLRGRLVGEQLRGTSYDGEHQGEWVGTRYWPKGLGDVYEARADHGLSVGPATPAGQLPGPEKYHCSTDRLIWELGTAVGRLPTGFLALCGGP